MPSFVATQTIVVRGEDGQPEELMAGRTFVHESRHFLIRKYPDLFEPVAIGKRKRSRSKPRWAL